MAAPLSLFQLLMGALQESRPGMAPDSPAEIATKYPQSWEPDPKSGAQKRFLPPTDVPSLEERRLSLSRYAEQALPDYQWIVPPQGAGQFTSNSRPPTLHWLGAPLPAPGGRLKSALVGTRGGPMPPPWPPEPSKNFQREMPEELKVLGSTLTMYPELIQELLRRAVGESEDANSPVSPLIELYSKKRTAKSKSGRLPDMKNMPGTVPDEDADAQAAAAEEDNPCDKRRYREVAKCHKRYPLPEQRLVLRQCLNRAEVRKNMCYANGYTPSFEEPGEWSVEDEEGYGNHDR